MRRPALDPGFSLRYPPPKGDRDMHKLLEMYGFVEEDALLIVEELEPKLAPDQSAAGFLD